MSERKPKTIFLIAVAVVFVPGIMAGTVQEVIQKGNSLYDKGNFADALKKYDQALVDQPQLVEPKFNKANCYFRLDDLTKAMELYQEVTVGSKNMELVEKAKYNLGNCYFHQGIKQRDSDLQKALEDLKTSIVCWRNALEINPENRNAAQNIEVARLTIKDIIDQINKQKEQQQQQAEKQKQLQEQLQELSKRQKALAQKTDQTKNDTDKGQISPQQAQDQYNQQAREQSELKDQTQQMKEQIQQQDPNQPSSQQMQKAASELEQAINSQSNAETQLKMLKRDTAKKAEDKAAEHIDNALKEVSKINQQKQDQQQEQQSEQQQQQNSQEQTSEQSEQQQQQNEQKASAAPDATAQEIIDQEQQKKEQRQNKQRGSYPKVEKDW